MRKTFTYLGILVAVVSATASEPPPAAASKPARRVVTESYTGALAVLIGNESTPSAYVGDCDPGEDEGCVRFSLRPGDRFIRFAIDDATGQPVYGTVWGSDGSELGDICGVSEPIPSPGGFVDVWLTYGNCWKGVQTSAPTTGTVTATITSARR